MRAYGMDSGRNEGRRNHVSSRYVYTIYLVLLLMVYSWHSKYVDPHDLSNRLRIRYTVSGPKGRATVYAEVGIMTMITLYYTFILFSNL